MFDSFDAFRPIFTPDPVVRNHPLNRGCIAWWMCVPDLMGGTRWVDLMGLNHGTLTNMTTAASGWRGTTRPGGWGHLLCGGGNTSVLTALATPTSASAPLTTAAWFRLIGSPGGNHYLWDSSTGTNKDWAQVYSSKLRAGVNTSYFSDSAATIAQFLWYRVCTVFDGVNFKAYLNASLNLGFSLAAVGNAAGTDSRFMIGADGTGASGANAEIDSVKRWTRALSDVEVAAEFDLERRGYPGLLRRWPQAAMTAAAAPPPPPTTSGKAVRWYPGLARPHRVRPRLRAR